MKRSSVLAACAVLLGLTPSTPLLAQLRAPGEPAAPLLQGDVPTLAVPVPDVSALLAEDVAREARNEWPLRYGVPVSLPFAFERIAAWEVSSDGERLVGRVRLVAPGAFSLGVEFQQFGLPAGAQVFLYDDAMTNVFGAYTAANASPDGQFVIEPFPGESVVVEYSQPADAPLDARIVLDRVIYDYRDLFALEASLSGDEGSFLGGCTVNVNCPDGDPFPNQKRATVRTIFGGGLCSGSILNNTAQDQTPYLYTANHCGTGSGVVVRFGYQTPNCTGGGAPTGMNMSGATLLASDLDTDGRLLRLNNDIPDSFNPYYSGWSRSSTNLSFGMSMHHPGGNPKNISIDSNGGGAGTSNFQGIGPVKVWFMNFQVGGTAGGSSGGPLFDQNNHVRGTLTGGPQGSCTNSQYGRFHSFWNETSIATWLDPLNSNPTTLGGLDPFADLIPAAVANIGPTSGPAGGFTSVTVNGSGFDGVVNVTFGGVPAKSFNVLSNAQLTAVTPTGVAGSTVAVAVIDGFGTATLPNAFTFTANPAPNVTLLAPDSGLQAGGTVVTMTGPSVLGVTQVQFGGVAGTSLTVLSPTELRVTTPPGASTGEVDVLLVGNGNQLLPDAYTYFNTGSFVTLSPGLPGGNGIAPLLLGSGDLVPGGNGFSLSTIVALPNTTGVMLLSLTPGAAPFKGGTLYTVPVAASFNIFTNFLGQVSIFVPLDNSVPNGASFVVQQLFVDPGAVAGVSMSNGLIVNLGSS